MPAGRNLLIKREQVEVINYTIEPNSTESMAPTDSIASVTPLTFLILMHVYACVGPFKA